VKKILVEELDMRLRFHGEIRLQLCAFRQEGYVAVEDVYLLTLLADEGKATPEGEAAERDRANERGKDGEHSEARLLRQ